MANKWVVPLQSEEETATKGARTLSKCVMWVAIVYVLFMMPFRVHEVYVGNMDFLSALDRTLGTVVLAALCYMTAYRRMFKFPSMKNYDQE